MSTLAAATTTNPLLHTRHLVAMDTFVTLTVVGATTAAVATAALDRAAAWFPQVEAACSRFDPASEVRQLVTQVGRPVALSPLLYEAIAFALAVAEATDGAFDPTIGGEQVRRGFDRNYQTGERSAPALSTDLVSFRDVTLHSRSRSLTLHRPLLLDLGAVAKGLALDLAARELAAYPGSLVEAGGDLVVQGINPAGEDWSVGIRHPRQPDALLTTLRLTDAAVCTSGDYERPAKAQGEHHLLDPRSGQSPRRLSSVTTVAPTALAADSLGTAAFILGPAAALPFLQAHSVAALLVAPDGTEYVTPDLERMRQ